MTVIMVEFPDVRISSGVRSFLWNRISGLLRSFRPETPSRS